MTTISNCFDVVYFPAEDSVVLNVLYILHELSERDLNHDKAEIFNSTLD